MTFLRKWEPSAAVEALPGATQALGEIGSMGSNPHGAVLKDVETLFHSGTIGGLTDAELLGRFADRHDESAEPAFTALLQRHGPMVLRVCRSVLRDEHDAQDAFQATFLILVRRAAAVRKRGSVGSWLYGVALRVSTRARAAMARRRRHEARAAQLAALRSADERNPHDLAAILHEELGRLPERYRAAVVLCYLEGQTCESAARQLGWPVGTVKSRLARGRERLLARLIRRGLGSEESSESRSATTAVLPAALTNQTVRAMLQFASGRSTVGLASSTALSRASSTLRIMNMTRLAMNSILLAIGLVATGAAVLATQHPESAKPAGRVKKAPQERRPTEAAAAEKKVEMVTVRVVDTRGQGVPNVEVEVYGHMYVREDTRHRSGADGIVRIPVDPDNETRFLSRPDGQTLGWAYRPEAQPGKAPEDKAIPLVLLPRRHQVEGSVVDRAGKPIRGVQVRVMSVQHVTNQTMIDFEPPQEVSHLGSAVTDEAGRYTLSLPEKSTAGLIAFHPRYVGPGIECGPGERTIAPVMLEDAGGIVGTLVDADTRRPVEGAMLYANTIEFDLRNRRLTWVGLAISDARGRFQIGGLGPGVYNLQLLFSPRGDRFTAQAIEGVRVEARKDAPADLKLVAGRRLHGTVLDVRTGKPMGGVSVTCSNSALPSSGNAGKAGHTDDQGRFEFYVPAGLACVYLKGASPYADRGADTRTLIVPADRDPDPVRLRGSHEPNDPLLEKVRAHTPGRPTQVRVKAEAGKEPSRDGARTLIGRILDQDGAPIASVQVIYNDRKSSSTVTSATDRQGVFRLRDVSPDRHLLGLHKKGYNPASAIIPPEASEIEVTLPHQPEPRG